MSLQQKSCGDFYLWYCRYVWYVYIVKCADNTLYTGTTIDVTRRIIEHNRKKGGACTSARLPVELVYKESHETRSDALKREHQIKRWPRKKKLVLISNNKTALKELSKSHESIDICPT